MSSRSIFRFSRLRLLPITIVAMAALLVVKSGHLVLAATSEATAASPPAAGKAEAAAPTPSAAKSTVPAGAKETIAEPAKTDAPSAVLAPPASDSERSLLSDLRQRRLALDAREAALATRELTLAAVEKRLSVRVDELTSLQTRLEGLERQRHDHDEANWRGLVKLYEAMKPRDAAAIFNDLDLPVLLPVLDRMKEAKAAQILSAMLPDRARLATTELAQMRSKANSIEQPAAPAPPPSGPKG